MILNSKGNKKAYGGRPSMTVDRWTTEGNGVAYWISWAVYSNHLLFYLAEDIGSVGRRY